MNRIINQTRTHLLYKLVQVVCLVFFCLSGSMTPVAGAYQGTATHVVTVEKPITFARQAMRPVFVTAKRLGKDLSSPETITISIVDRAFSGNHGSVWASTEVIIPAGKTTVEAEIEYLPRRYGSTQMLVVSNNGSTNASGAGRGTLASESLGWESFNSGSEYSFLHIYQKGAMPDPYPTVDIRKMEGQRNPFVYTSRRAAGAPSDQGIPTYQHLSNLLDQSELVNNNVLQNATVPTAARNGNAPASSALTTYQHLSGVPLERVPKRLIGLQSVDFALIDVSALQALASQDPDRTECLRKWVAAGGKLIVRNCGSEFIGLPSVLPNLTAHQEERPQFSLQRWSIRTEIPTARLMAEIRNKRTGNQSYGYTYNTETAIWLDDLPSGKQRILSGRATSIADQLQEQQAELASYDYGLGRIVVTASDLSDANEQDWATLLSNCMANNAWSVQENLGTDHAYMRGISGFEVPDVGQPPKLTFLALISLFSITVGPVAFIILNRINRLNLLLILIPFLSAASVTALFLYVVVADGFDFRVNRLSVTELDMQNRLAVTQTSQAVYSGRTPGSYTIGNNVLFGTGTDDTHSRLRVWYRDGETEISEGRIAVRTKHDFTTLDVNNVDWKIELLTGEGRSIIPGRDWGNVKKVRYNIPMQAEMLIIRSANGFLVGDQLAANSTADLQAVDQLNRQLSNYTKELSENVSSMYSTSRYDPYYGYSEGRGLTDAGIDHETGRYLGRLTQRLALLEASQAVQNLRPGEFLCICRDSELATKLQDDAKYIYQFHLIHGHCEVQ